MLGAIGVLVAGAVLGGGIRYMRDGDVDLGGFDAYMDENGRPNIKFLNRTLGVCGKSTEAIQGVDDIRKEVINNAEACGWCFDSAFQEQGDATLYHACIDPENLFVTAGTDKVEVQAFMRAQPENYTILPQTLRDQPDICAITKDGLRGKLRDIISGLVGYETGRDANIRIYVSADQPNACDDPGRPKLHDAGNGREVPFTKPGAN